MTLIELDLTQSQEPALSAPPPAHAYRVPGLLLALAVLLTLGAAAAPAPAALWRTLGDIPLRHDDTFTPAGDQLYTTSGSGRARGLVAYSLTRSPRRLWSVPFPDRPDPYTGYVGSRLIGAYRSGGQVVVGDGNSWVVADAGTGRVRWRPGAGLTLISGGGLGFDLHTQFQPGTEYAVDSGDPGALYFGENGVPHTKPPLVTHVRGLSVADGRLLWTYDVPGSINAFRAPGNDPAVLLVTADSVVRLDGRTGNVVEKESLEPIVKMRPASGQVLDGTLVVEYQAVSGSVYGAAGFDLAYDPRTLAVRWRRAVPDIDADRTDCVRIVCEAASHVVVDARTGRPTWQFPAGTALEPIGKYLLEYNGRTNRPLRLADPATGKVRLDLRAWATGQVPVAGDRTIVLDRDLGPAGTAFATVDPARDELRPLGTSPDRVDDCAAEQGIIACRVGDSLRVWSYQL